MEASGTLSVEALREQLLQGLKAEHVVEEYTTPGLCATSFKVLVASPRSQGKALLHQHWLVNEILVEELKRIHAFEQRTLRPEQWVKEQEAT
ncbi:Hypothetical predicted protein, partial [Podarcis lilfordi]